MDDKWLVVIAMGMAAFNVVLLRNAFESVPYEIEEAGIVDGATDFQLSIQSVYTDVEVGYCDSRAFLWDKQMERLLLGENYDTQQKRVAPAGIYQKPVGRNHGAGIRSDNLIRAGIAYLCDDCVRYYPDNNNLPLYPESTLQRE